MILKILKFVFITLGIILFIFIVAAVVFIIVDPLSLRPLLFNLFTSSPTAAPKSDKHPLLNENQEKLLETIGVDVEGLPTEITPEMEECFTEKLGPERTKEIIGGASPGLIDFLKAKECLEK